MSDSAHTHASRGPAVLAVSASTLGLCTLFVSLRLISRFAIVKKPGWDDYCIVLAWCLAFGATFTSCYGTSRGLGRHQDQIPPGDMVPMKKAAYAFSVLYNPALMATKTSILLFYLTLSRTQKIFRRATLATLAVVNIGGLALALLNTLQCQPVSAAWRTPPPPSASCTNIVTIYLSSAPLNIITDLAILFLPMPILTGMRLPVKEKVILVITFGFGVFVTAVDVVRIAYLHEAALEYLNAIQNHVPVQGISSRDATDFSWYASFAFMWSAVEINIGICCACVPALKPLMSRFLPRWIHDRTLREKTASHTGDSKAVHPDIVASRQRASQNSPAESPPPKPESVLSKPSPEKDSSDEPMGLLDFLNAPDMNKLPQLTPPNNATPARTRAPAFFDFVQTAHKKNITMMTNRESVHPIIMVTVLFFIWGFAYGLLDTLNTRFQDVAQMSIGQTVGQHSAYYLGYLIGPLTFGRMVFRHWGFKACYTVGLGLYACGTLVFWPSAVLTSFPAFLISNFITGLGLSTLEISANPFIALCGPPEYAEARLSMSQAIQAIGTIVSPLLARKVLFKASPDNLINVQWTYLGISFFTIFLALVYYYIPLPEATDEQLEEASARLPIPREAKLGSGKVQVIWVSLALGVASQFFYVGGQEATATTFSTILHYVMPSLNADNHTAVGQTAFAVSRFIAAFMNIWMKPRYVLLFFFIGSIVFAAACMNGSGATSATFLVMLMFFEGPLFPMIYALPLRGMGKYTKDAAVLLTAATSGGAVFPPIIQAVSGSRNPQYAFCVVVAAYAAGALYPIYLNLYPAARRVSDPVRDEVARRESSKKQKHASGPANKKRFSFRPGRRLNKGHNLPTVEPSSRAASPVQSGNGTMPGRASTEGNTASESLGFHTAPSWLNDTAPGVSKGDKIDGRESTHDVAEGPSSSVRRPHQPQLDEIEFQSKPDWLDFATNERATDGR